MCRIYFFCDVEKHCVLLRPREGLIVGPCETLKLGTRIVRNSSSSSSSAAAQQRNKQRVSASVAGGPPAKKQRHGTTTTASAIASVALTRETRKGKTLLNLPGGKGEAGETTGATAARKAYEETGKQLTVRTCAAMALAT